MLVSCSKVDGDAETTTSDKKTEGMTFTSDNIGRYISLPEYKGLEISVAEGESRGDAVFSKIVSEAVVIEYPEEQLSYYIEQQEAKYRYIAASSDSTYDEILERFGITAEGIEAESKSLVKNDLVFYGIVYAEEITVTEQEKTDNFEKYVEKYTLGFGYAEEYVRSNMTDEIYESMLYDKTLERLIVLNSFK